MTGDQLASCLARSIFARDLVVVDRCGWTGDECDLLVLTRKLRVVDVEIKISRADLKRDRDKGKWYDSGPYEFDDVSGRRRCKKIPRQWPRRVWKHYYALPREIWKPEMLELCGPHSGVILVDPSHPAAGHGARLRAEARNPKHWWHWVERRARPNPENEPLAMADLVAVARLASLRMWDAYHDHDQLARDKAALAAAQAPQPVTGELMPRERTAPRISITQPARRQGKSLAAGILPHRAIHDEPAPAAGLVLEPSPDKTGRARRKRIRRA